MTLTCRYWDMTSRLLIGTRENMLVYALPAKRDPSLTGKSRRLPQLGVWYWFRAISVIFGYSLA